MKAYTPINHTWRRPGLAALAVMAVLALSGCTGGALVSKAPDDKPPQLVKLGARDAQGRDYLVWDRPSAFGPVPAELQAPGDLSCMQGQVEMRAVGYHPLARGLDGAAIAGGAYFCARTSSSGSPPPQVVRQGDTLGWDRPGAFGPVPAELRERGNRECAARPPLSRALAYHPAPLDQQGQPMQGGFLCIAP